MSNVLKVSLQVTIKSLADRGWSQRRIAGELGIDRETVRRYIGLSKPAISITGLEDRADPKPAISIAGNEEESSGPKPAISIAGIGAGRKNLRRLRSACLQSQTVDRRGNGNFPSSLSIAVRCRMWRGMLSVTASARSMLQIKAKTE